jgi:hypothetical protein
MCSSPQKDIYVHLTSRDEQRIRVARRNDSVAMGEANAETAMSNDLGERKVGRVNIKVTLDQLQVGCNLSQKLEGVAICEVA